MHWQLHIRCLIKVSLPRRVPLAREGISAATFYSATYAKAVFFVERILSADDSSLERDKYLALAQI